MTQKDVLEILKTGQNVFLTGPAGSGKTFLKNYQKRAKQLVFVLAHRRFT